VYQKQGKQYYDDSCFNKLGVIDYEQDDEHYIDLTDKALKWIQLCKTDQAKKWDVFHYPLKYEELYPNMSNQKDDQWKHLKNDIAKTNHELTNLWQVGKKHRHIGISNGIYDWKNKKCTAKKLGINGKTAIILDKIIKINQTKKDLLLPHKIASDCFDWNKPDKIEFFVDFEYKNAVFDQMIKLPVADTTILLFTIGVGYVHPHKNKWVFKNFTVDHLTEKEEFYISQEFVNFIYHKSKKYHIKNPKCWHWSFAEPNVFNNILIKYNKIKNLFHKHPFQWCDLLTLFHKEPIVVHGALNFKLKTIAHAMYKHGFIKTIWDSNTVENGQMAMIETVEADLQAKKKKVSMKTLPAFTSVLQYNEIDVKVLHEILDYLRSTQQKSLKRQFDGPAMHTRSVRPKLL
jgi:hypothetical protein